jgi:hypothetical protein
MQGVTGGFFPHRHNADRSYDSICPACYVTVATEDVESKLRQHELAHACDPIQLDRVGQEHLPQPPFRCAK